MRSAGALVWASGWATGPFGRASSVRSALIRRVARLGSLLVDDVPLARAGDPSALPEAYTPGTLRNDCLLALIRFANASMGLRPGELGALGAPLNRSNLAAILASPVDALNASATLSAVAAVPGGRDLAWAALTGAWWARLRTWYAARSTLAQLVRSTGRAFTSLPYSAALDAWWGGPTGAAAGLPVLQGTWQRAIESVQAGAAWAASQDAADLCAFLVEHTRV